MSEEAGQLEKKKQNISKGGEISIHIFMYYIVSHTIFVSLAHTQGRLWQHEKIAVLNAMLFFMLSPLHTVRSLATHTPTVGSHLEHIPRSFVGSRSLTLFFPNGNNIIFIHIWIFQFSSVFRLKRFFSRLSVRLKRL